MTAFEDFVTEQVAEGPLDPRPLPGDRGADAHRLRRLAQGQGPLMRRAAALLAALLLASPAAAELRGHGGPVRALAIAPDGRYAISGGFDQSAIPVGPRARRRDRGLALSRRRGQRGRGAARRAVRERGRGRQDRALAPRRVEARPVVIAAHEAPIAALAVSPDGAFLASASWDETMRLTPLAGGAARRLAAHRGNVLAVAVARDGWSPRPASTRACASGATARSLDRADADRDQRARAGGRRRDPRRRRRRRDPRAAARRRRAARARRRPRADRRARGDARRRARRGLAHPRAGGDPRSRRRDGAHASRRRPGDLVARLHARRGDAAHRRRRPRHPAVERRDRRGDRGPAAGRPRPRPTRPSAARSCSAPARPATR